MREQSRSDARSHWVPTTAVNSRLADETDYKYIRKLLYEIIIVGHLVIVRKML